MELVHEFTVPVPVEQAWQVLTDVERIAQADGGTTVSIVTDLSISGRVAQFGRGVMGDVSARLLEQFVRNLETGVLGGGPPAG
jgi:carbon monoxide dehydrogenase subunit G